MQPYLREPLFDASEQALKPFDLEIGVETTLHQDSGAAHLECLGYLLINRLEVENVTFRGEFAFKGPVKGTKAAILGAKICIVDVAVNNVSDYPLGMQLAPKRIGFHAQADEVIRAEIIEGLRPGNRHKHILRVWQPTIQCYSARDVVLGDHLSHLGTVSALRWAYIGAPGWANRP